MSVRIAWPGGVALLYVCAIPLVGTFAVGGCMLKLREGEGTVGCARAPLERSDFDWAQQSNSLKGAII